MIFLAMGVGLAMLFFGRQLFWLFVAGAGFVAGMLVAGDLMHDQQDWVVLLVAVTGGLLGALLAIFLQKLAVGIGGFLAGGYIFFTVASRFDESSAWIALVIGGILGVFLVYVLFEWALIVLSSLTGAVLITESVNLKPELALVVFGVSLLAGLAIQAGQLKKHPAASEDSKPG